MNDDKTIPIHQTKYHYIEPGLFTNSRTAYLESSPGSCIYIINRNGQFLPPCGSDLSDDAARIGCHHIVAKADAVAVYKGWALSGIGKTMIYHWYDAEQVRLLISCHIGSY